MRINFIFRKKNLYWLFFFFFLLACTRNKSTFSPTPLPDNPYFWKNLKIDRNGLSKLTVILITVYGEIEIKFYPQEAPKSVTRFLTLISIGFYTGLKFHRVIPNYILQTGDPTGSGTGGSGVLLAPEFNRVPHIRGTVALARGNDINSADSQFYIALTSLPHLDAKFTVIGQVTTGIELLDKIKQGDEILVMKIKREP